MSTTAVEAGIDGETLAAFAEPGLRLHRRAGPAASVAGHDDESAMTGRARQELLDRLAQQLLDGSPPEAVLEAAERADWAVPTTLTAVLAPAAQVRPVLGAISPDTLRAVDLPGSDEDVLLLVPDAHGRRRPGLLRALRDRGAVAGPARPWGQVRASYDRARRARQLGLGVDTETHLPELVLTADPDALADLRARVLAPLADLRPAGRREAHRDAARLAAPPRPARRRGRLAVRAPADGALPDGTAARALYGERLDDPETVLALTLALGVPSAAAPKAD